jgi:ribonuclease E
VPLEEQRMAAARDASHAKPRAAAGEPAGAEARPRPEPKAAVESGAADESRREQGEGASRRRRGRRRGRNERKPEQTAVAGPPAGKELDEDATQAMNGEAPAAAIAEAAPPAQTPFEEARAEALETPAWEPAAPAAGERESAIVSETFEPAPETSPAAESAAAPFTEEQAGTLAEAEVEAETAPEEIRVERADEHPAPQGARPGWAPAETIRFSAEPGTGSDLVQIETDPRKLPSLPDFTEEAQPPRIRRVRLASPAEEGPLVQVETRK